MHPDLVEQDFLYRFITAGSHVGRFVIAAAQVHGDRHIGRDIRHRDVDEIAVNLSESLGIVPAIHHLLAVFGIAQHGDEYFIELQIAAAGISEGTHRLAVGLTQVGEKLIELGIDALVDRSLQRTAIDGRRCRYCNFRHPRRVVRPFRHSDRILTTAVSTRRARA